MKLALYIGLAIAALVSGPTDKIEFEAPESYPEGVAFNPGDGLFYVSSARFGTIGQVSRDGSYKKLYEDQGLKSSYGLKIHPDKKRVFACISDANYSKYKTAATDKKMARLIAIDIQSGKKTLDVDLSGLVDSKHFANDLTFDPKGNAYITDSFANAIYMVTPQGKASLVSQSPMFKTQGVGLNGIAWHEGNFLLVTSSGTGAIYKVSLSNPAEVSRVEIPQFFANADGLLLRDPKTLILVQNGGTHRIFELESKDMWKSASLKAATRYEDRFAFPSTATMSNNEVWVMNAKFHELNDSTTVPSKKFSIQKANFIKQ